MIGGKRLRFMGMRLGSDGIDLAGIGPTGGRERRFLVPDLTAEPGR
jgi:hypothetical protein